MQLVTENTVLREVEKNDLDNIYLMGSDPKITKYLDYIAFNYKEAANAWLEEKITANEENPRFAYNFAIKLKDTYEFAGWIGIGKAADTNKGDLDFGYAVLQKFQGKGIAREALKAIIEMAWRETTANKIFGECDINNFASRKVMENAGMKLVTEFGEGNNKQVRYETSRLK